MPPKIPPGQELSKKDDATFKTVMKFYESKQLKKAFKAVQTVLASNPNHAESLAMKGLLLNSPPYNKKEEAYELVKLGLSKHLKSLICWHVYGLLHRGDQNYAEAIKCYKQALKIEDNNISILRDLAMLQIHMRDLSSLAETRQKLLEVKAHSKINWQMFAFAHHLQGNYECALAILDTYEGVMGLPETPYEMSEFLLYRILVKFESGDWEGTLKMFEQYDSKLVDREYVYVTSAECHEHLNQLDKAAACYEKLLEINPENNEFVDAYIKVCSGDDEEKAVKKYAELREKYPTSQTIQKMEVDSSTGEKFRTLARAFIKRYILKAIPSLGSAIKSFYSTDEKKKILGEILFDFEKEVTEKETVDSVKADKSTIVWVWLALAHHHLRCLEAEKALEVLEKAIEHTPTLDCLYSVKAKILKRMGRLDEAAEWMDTARRMDTADRYVNTKSVLYHLRCNKFLEAEKIFNLFTYKPLAETWSNVLDMQVMWYEIELADCLYRLGDIESALKRYLLVDKHFNDIQEDEFDFHHYINKKHNVRAYLDLLRFMDNSRNHKFYCTAAKKVVRCYLDIHKLGKEEVQKRFNADLVENDKERSKKLNKEQKEKDQEYQMEVKYDDPLKAAAKPFLREILKYRGTELDTQLLAIELYTAQKKTLKALQNVKQALTLPNSSSSVELKAAADSFFAAAASEQHPIVKEIVDAEKAEIMGKFTCS